MSKWKKRGKGLALALAVVVLAGGTLDIPARGASVGSGQQRTGGQPKTEETAVGEEKDAGKAAGTQTNKNVVSGTGSSSSGVDNTVDGGKPEGGAGTVTGSENTGTGESSGNDGTGSGTTSGSGGTGSETNPEENGNTGTGTTPGDGNTGTGTTPGDSNTGTGTTPGDSNTGTGTTPEDSNTGTGTTPGDGNTGTGTTPGDGNTGTGTTPGDSNTGTGTTPGDGNTGTGTTPGNGNTGTGTTPGEDQNNGTGTGSEGTTDPSETPGAGDDQGDEEEEQGTHKILIDGKEETFRDFAEIWEKVDGKTGEIQLTENVSVTASAGSVCKLTGGDVTLDLNGYTLSYTRPASRSSSGAPDLIEISGGTLTVTGEGTVRYNGNSTYSGACLYATGDAVLNIQGGTFSSNVSAPVCMDGATLNIEGNTSDVTISAVTMNNGTLNISGDRVSVGTLTLNRSNDSMTVRLGKGSSFSRIESKGSGDAAAFKISELPAEGCGFRSGGTWITDEARLSGNSISGVTVDTKPFTSLKLSVSPALENGGSIPFSYSGDQTWTLTAQVDGNVSGELKYQWYRTYNGARQEIDGTGTTCTFSNKDDAGAYVYHVGASSGAYEEWATFEVNITPLSAGTITNNNYQTTYTYGEFAAPPANGGSCFSVDSGNAQTRDFKWSYQWYRESAADGNEVNMPSDVGTYILRVEASDGPNYQATGDISVTITQRIVTPVIEGTTSKVYDGTAEAKGVEVKLNNVVQGDAGGVGVRAASIAYNDANVRLANRIVASGIELTGNKAGNYILSSTQASAEASISKAELLIQMSVSPNTQKINRPVTVTVTVLNSDNSPVDNQGLKADDVVLTVSGRNDMEEEHTLSLTASEGRYGVYTAEYTTDIKGDKTLTARIAGSANYEVKNVASDNSLTILEKTGAVMTLTADETEDIVYGDEVTYTAVVSKENEDDADALSGTVQFYEEEIADNNKIGSAQSIVMSGDRASITLDESTLEAGDHKILAVFSGSASFEDVSAEVSTAVAKKQLTWDVSGLSASKAAGTAGEVTVYGELKLDGLLDEDDVTFERPAVLKTNGLKSAEAGSYKVTVVSEDKEWKFDPEEPKNYELPENDPEITAKVNAVKELPNPPVDTEDGKKFKLVMEEGISAVPEGLVNTSFNTPAKIEQELKRVLTESGVYKPENTAVYDVVLQVSTDEGNTWQVADYTNFPEGGLSVTLPYPGGTGRYTNNFAVAHMFSTSYFGKTSGQVEIPAVRKTDNGMEFTVTGLSPIGLAWSGPMDAVNNTAGGTGSGSRRIQGALTWDNNPILFYACIAGGAALVIVVAVTCCIVRGKKKKKKIRR